ncbi:MAG: M81 family metallopeptidase [Gemmatimonadetes bacterium]|nr:M81 family metallopeptidase [Gemmatimonadota bacterium]
MKRVLLAGFKQETAVFNPTCTRYDTFHIRRGEEIASSLRHTHTEFAGGLEIFAAAGDIEVVPTWAGWSVSGGPVHPPDLDRMIDELLAAVRANADVDGAYIVFHGAMAGEDEDDPEGRVLTAVREILGDIPLVISLDLHAVLTDSMVEKADLHFPFHTYPHTDLYETGQRAARGLLALLAEQVRPTTHRVELPMLVRGDELITATGRFGEAIRACQEIESSESGLAAGVLIGNPFTDVPALQSNVLVSTDGDPGLARLEAEKIARFMWQNREQFVAPLKSIEEAISIAEETEGLTVFSDAADATSSGAPGDSNTILKELVAQRYSGKALLSLVDEPAAKQAFAAGVGATLTVPLGGNLDTGRHSPLEIEVYVKTLSDGNFTYAGGTPEQGGPTAVLVIDDRIHVVVTSRPVHIMDRSLFQAHGLEPATFDLVSVKSPNGFRPHYESSAAAIVPVDAPGATSANLHSLPYRRCVRPIFPLDPEVSFPLAGGE